ncbi:MAG: hypothetical protein ABL977_17335 [Candidatus Eisenbacteria bacterium]
MPRRRIILNAPPPVAGARTRTVEVGGESRELLPFEPMRGEVLTWRQPHWNRNEYWLESSRGTHLLLHIPSMFIRKPCDCPVESASNSWRIHMGWGIGAHAMPLSDAQGVELMRRTPRLFGRGPVVLADGSKLPWRRTWSGFELRDSGDQMLIEQRQSFAWFRAEATITLSDAAHQRSDILPLLALTWLAALDSRQTSQ